MIKILIGPSLSGKTTWTNEFLAENPKYRVVSRDIERISLFGKYRMGNSKEENLISKICEHKIYRLLEAKFNVILDNTHLRQKYIDEIVSKYNHLSDIELVFFPLLDFNTLMNRNVREEKIIPEKVLKRQINQYNTLVQSNPKVKYPKVRQRVKFNKWSFTKQNVFVFDIDGTLSNSHHRNIYNCTDEEILLDEDILPTHIIVKSLVQTGRNVIFMSGRSDKYFDVTLKWLSTVIGLTPSRVFLHMRKEGDYRPDWIVKQEMWDTHLSDKNVLGYFEDRQQMIDHWKEKGVFTFNVGQSKSFF